MKYLLLIPGSLILLTGCLNVQPRMAKATSGQRAFIQKTFRYNPKRDLRRAHKQGNRGFSAKGVMQGLGVMAGAMIVSSVVNNINRVKAIEVTRAAKEAKEAKAAVQALAVNRLAKIGKKARAASRMNYQYVHHPIRKRHPAPRMDSELSRYNHQEEMQSFSSSGEVHE